jgi:hypothetical protein
MKNQIVTCEHAWPFVKGTPLVEGKKYEVLKSFWRNGEGHFVVKRADGSTRKLTTSPDVFFDDIRRN